MFHFATALPSKDATYLAKHEPSAIRTELRHQVSGTAHAAAQQQDADRHAPDRAPPSGHDRPYSRNVSTEAVARLDGTGVSSGTATTTPATLRVERPRNEVSHRVSGVSFARGAESAALKQLAWATGRTATVTSTSIAVAANPTRNSPLATGVLMFA